MIWRIDSPKRTGGYRGQESVSDVRQDRTHWCSSLPSRKRQESLAALQSAHQEQVEQLRQQAASQCAEVDALCDALQRLEPDAVTKYFGLVLQASPYAESFVRKTVLAFSPESRQLVSPCRHFSASGRFPLAIPDTSPTDAGARLRNRHRQAAAVQELGGAHSPRVGELAVIVRFGASCSSALTRVLSSHAVARALVQRRGRGSLVAGRSGVVATASSP